MRRISQDHAACCTNDKQPQPQEVFYSRDGRNDRLVRHNLHKQKGMEMATGRDIRPYVPRDGQLREFWRLNLGSQDNTSHRGICDLCFSRKMCSSCGWPRLAIAPWGRLAAVNSRPAHGGAVHNPFGYLWPRTSGLV